MEDPVLAQALELIEELSQGPVTVEDIVESLPLARRTLERKFHNVLGRTILEEINRCRLKRAVRLLTNSGLSISEVSAAAGFSTVNRMGQVFQRVYHMSPGEYRIRK